VEARRKPPRARANRGEERARQPSGPVQGRRIAKRTHPKAISRLPSGAGRNARRPLARGKARLARSSPHDDRHRTNGTKLPRADRQAAIPAPRKKSPPVPDHAKNAFEPMFSGVRRIFGIIYPGFSGIRVPLARLWWQWDVAREGAKWYNSGIKFLLGVAWRQVREKRPRRLRLA
jgi:hypothetical protein